MSDESVNMVYPHEDGSVEFVLKNGSKHRINFQKIQQELNGVFYANGLFMKPIGFSFNFEDNGMSIDFDITTFRAWNGTIPKQ